MPNLSDEQIRAMAEELEGLVRRELQRLRIKPGEGETCRRKFQDIITRHLRAAGPDERMGKAVGLLKEARGNMNYHGQDHRPCPACQQGVKDIDAFLAEIGATQ